MLREPDEYIGCGTDEHWRTFDDQEPATVNDSQHAPVFTAPASGSTVPFAGKIVLAWNQSSTDTGAPPGDVAHDGPTCPPDSSGVSTCCPEWNTGALSTLHEPAISGNVYDLQFTVDGKLVHRVVTTLQKWTPPDAVWSSWRGKDVTLKMWRMTLLRNELRPDTGSGPFVSAPFTLHVGA